MFHLPFLFLSMVPMAGPDIQADVVIRGATLYDGTDKPGVAGDLAIRNDRIVALGTFQTAGKPRIIDGKGMVVAPGFIDLHTHSDRTLLVPATRSNTNYLFQGVTSVVTGNCGKGPVNVADYYKSLETNRVGCNVLHQVPHNDVRSQAMGNSNRAPTAAELKKMEELIDQGMRDGAWSLSTGLIYNPGTYAQTDELIALAKVAKKHGVFYVSHIRNESTGLLTAIDEILTIGQKADIPIHISHLKASGKQAWGKVADAISMIEQARSKGQKVTADQYPYTAGSTALSAMVIPPIFREGTPKDFQERVNDREQGPRVRAGIEERIKFRDAGKSIRIAVYRSKPAWQGKDLETIAAQEKKSMVDIILEIERNGGAQINNFSMNEEDVRLVMKQSFVATASDGIGMVPDGTFQHPRSYGCFPRKIGRYAIADQVVPLEQALRSATGLPADILQLPERGYLKPGFFADLVVFDPQTFRDQATFEKPHQYSTGVRYLFINGKLVIDQGKYNGSLAGKVLRHQSKAAGN